GQPHLSFFGTTQVLTTDQLALWARNPATGFLQRIAANPKVALLYRNSAERASRATTRSGGGSTTPRPRSNALWMPTAPASPSSSTWTPCAAVHKASP